MTNLKPDIYSLLKAVIGSETLIWADQNSPRPAFPYWTMRVSSGRSIGMDSNSQGVTDDGDLTIKGVREATIQVQRIGNDSDFYVASFRDNLQKVTVKESFQLKSISLYDHADIQNAPFQIDSTRYEPRATIDLFIRFGSSLVDRVGVIENAQIDAGLITLETFPNVNQDLGDIILVNLDNLGVQ